MKRGLLLIAATLFSTSGFTPATEKMTVTEVLKKAIDAVGGAEAINKHPGTVQKAKGTVEVNGNDIEMTSESQFLDPDKFKQTITMEVGNMEIKIVQIVNGEKQSMTANGMDVPLTDEMKKEVANVIHMHNVSKLAPLLADKAFTVKLLDDKVKVDDKETYVVSVEREKMNEAKLYIDAKSFMVVKIERQGLIDGTSSGNHEMFQSDFKKFDGVMIATKSKVLHDGKKKIAMEILEVKRVKEFPKEDFEISK